MRKYYVYIMTNHTGTLYVGFTSNLIRRIKEHKDNRIPGFTTRYKIRRLVYFEETPNPIAALEREKQIKGWRRSRKVELIQSVNPDWKDLSEDWYE